MRVSRSLENGFTLIEILISVVVLAVGLLGLAALQINVIRYNHSAQLRSVAVSQLNTMVDRMRANYAGVKAGSYSNVTGIPGLPTCTNCTSSESATRDANKWNTSNAALLPSGRGTVVGSNGIYTITVRWDNDRAGVTGTGCSGNVKVDLTCLIMEVRL